MATLVPMNEAQFQRYLQATIPEFAADKVRSGQWTQAEALELARKSMQESLPQGLATPDNYLYAIENGPLRVQGAGLAAAAADAACAGA